MRLFNKKALLELTITPTFITLLVLGFILISMLAKISLLGDDLRHEKQFLAADMGIAIDSLHSIQGNAQFVYSDLAKFNFSYSTRPEIIEVFNGRKPSDDPARGVFYFTEDGPGGMVFYHKDLIPKNRSVISSVFIVKQGDEIFFDSPQVNKQFRTNLNLLSCPDKKIKLTRKDTIFIDPGHGWDSNKSLGDKGSIGAGQVFESEIVLGLARVLRGTLSRVSNVESTRGFTKDTDMPIEKKIQNSQSADALISLHVGSNDNTALAYYNVNSEKREESIRLGCRILNELSIAFPQIRKFAYVPVNIENELRSDPNTPYQILSKNQVAVLLEIGDINAAGPNFVVENQRGIATAILKGVEKYNAG